MQVIPLYGEFDQPRPEPPARLLDAGLQPAEGAPAAEVPDVVAHPQRDVDGGDPVEARPRRVRDAVAARPAGAFTSAAVRGEAELSRMCSHDFGTNHRTPGMRPVKSKAGSDPDTWARICRAGLAAGDIGPRTWVTAKAGSSSIGA